MHNSYLIHNNIWKDFICIMNIQGKCLHSKNITFIMKIVPGYLWSILKKYILNGKIEKEILFIKNLKYSIIKALVHPDHHQVKINKKDQPQELLIFYWKLVIIIHSPKSIISEYKPKKNYNKNKNRKNKSNKLKTNQYEIYHH